MKEKGNAVIEKLEEGLSEQDEDIVSVFEERGR